MFLLCLSVTIAIGLGLTVTAIMLGVVLIFIRAGIGYADAWVKGLGVPKETK